MESAAAAMFYLGLLAFCAGGVLAARAAAERKRTPFAVPLLAIGAIGIASAIVLYMEGPRRMLPF